MRQWLYLFFLLSIISCGNKGSENEILSSDKMEVVISDLMKADQFISDFRVPHDTAMDRDVESIKLYQQVFKLHGISKNQFEKSLAYYQARPELLKTMMDSISKPPAVDTVASIQRKDSITKKDSVRFPKDSTLLSRDSLLLRKKKIPAKIK